MAKRRSKRRDNAIFKLIVFISLFMGIMIGLLTIPFSGGRFNVAAFLIAFFATLVAGATIAIVLSVPSVKGKMGEKRVSKRLNNLAKKYGGYVIDDVMIPDEENGKTSQIDHIYISEYGVFVVETKNYSGRIYGNDSQREWTQVLAYGNNKNKLYNPVKQNQTHIYRLSHALNVKAKFISVIVFVAADISYLNSEYVYSLPDLKYLIDEDLEKTISPEDVDKIETLVREYKENPAVTNKEHVKEIRQMKKDVNNNICPRCGGQLVLRTSKTNGKEFYGCKNFPKCKFIKNI